MSTSQPRAVVTAERPERIGRIEFACLLGRGGMGSVYLARINQPDGEAPVRAVKLLHPTLVSEAGAAQSFLDEARVATQLHSGFIVPVLDYGFEEGRPFIAMEYVRGDSLAGLKSLLREAGEELPLGVALRWMLDALDGLHDAHVARGEDGASLELVHRDVSPHNLLVGIDGVARLTDFGLAKARSRPANTPPGVLKGKLPYMAPEQIWGPRVDARADLFSLAVTCWEGLTLRRLFAERATGSRLTPVMAAPYTPIGVYRAGMPSVLDDVLRCALSPEPSDRYASARALSDALRAGLGDAVASREEAARFAASHVSEKVARERKAMRAMRYRIEAAGVMDSGQRPAISRDVLRILEEDLTLDEAFVERTFEDDPAAQPVFDFDPHAPTVVEARVVTLRRQLASEGPPPEPRAPETPRPAPVATRAEPEPVVAAPARSRARWVVPAAVALAVSGLALTWLLRPH